MKIYTALENLPEDAQGAVIAIGNFDGVHKGHQALLNAGKARAAELGTAFGVLTFEPHPRRLFRPDEPPSRITPAVLKARRLAARQVDFLCTLTFDWDFASQSAEAFIGSVLKGALKPAHIIVGFDFCFGQLRKGNAQTLRQAGYEVTSIEKVTGEKGQDYSSSRIRQLLRKGNIEAANDILGWEWEMEGPVFHGDRRGHDLGFPTANVLLGETLHPAYGVYAALVNIEGEEGWRPAATNIGIRPMFEVPEGQIEAHILDFEDRDIYGRLLRVRPVKRLRGEAKFENLEDLVTQMKTDCAQTRSLLNT